MPRRGNGNNAPQGKKAYDNRRARDSNNHQNGQQQQQQQQKTNQGPPISAFLPVTKPPVFGSVKPSFFGSVKQSPFPGTPVSAVQSQPALITNAGSKKHDKNYSTNIRGGGATQFNPSPHQNDRGENPRELNSNGMESNPARSSSPSRGRGRGKSGDRGGGGRGRGSSDTRGRGRGGYQGRNDDGRGRNETRNDTHGDVFGGGPSTTSPAGDEADREFEENVRDLTATGSSRLARFSNNTSEQASYDELKVARQKERRDLIAKGLIDDPDNRSTLANAVQFVGTCMDMCPLFERAERAAQFNVDKWELNPQTQKTDKNFAVKKFHRPAAGVDAPLPSDVRPPRVLVSTLDYLINSFLDSDEKLKLTHGFLRDRTRSIRQDFTMQSYSGSEAVACHEIIARLHIVSLHKLADEPITKFVPQQEMEQLQKVLTTLQQLYDDARTVGVVYPNEPEFRAYQLIIHLRDQDQERQAQRWPRSIFYSQQVQQALKFFELAQRNNGEAVHLRVGNTQSCMNFFGTLFRLVKSKTTSYLQACLLEFHFNDIRKTALKAMKNTYRVETKLLFLKDIKEMLGYESEEFVIRDCQHYGLNVDQTEVDGNILWYLVIEKGGRSWNENAPAPKVNFHSSIERKIGNRTIAEICYGVKSMESPTKLNKTAAPIVPVNAAFGQLSAPTDSSSFFNKPTAFNNAAIPAQTQAFPAAVPVSQPPRNVFQNPTAPTQPLNPFQKAAASISSNQTPNVFEKALQARSSTPPLGVFGATGSAFAATTAPVSAFGQSNGALNPSANVFKPAGAKVLPGFSTPPTTTTAFNVPTQLPDLSQIQPGGHSPQQASASQSAFQPKATPGGFFQTPAISSSQAGYKQGPSQASSNGLFQPPGSFSTFPKSLIQTDSSQKSFYPPTSASSSNSGSVFEQAPKPSGGLFQPITSLSSPSESSVTNSTSLFQAQPAGPITTENSSGGSVFDNHSVQKQFPTNFFSVPAGTPSDYEEYDDDNNAYSVPTPVQASTGGGSLFDRISTPPTQDLFPQSAVDAPKAVPSFTLAPPQPSPSSITSTTSLTGLAPSTLPGSFASSFSDTPSTSFTAPAPPPTQQTTPAKRPLLSRSAAWNWANALFSDMVSKEMTKVVQEAVDENKARVAEEIAAEKYAESERLVAKQLALEVAAEQFYSLRSGARVFYSWKARARKLMLKRRAEERRKNPPAPVAVQWRPVKIPDAMFDGRYDEIKRMNSLTYKSVPLKEIFQPKVEAALWPTGEGDRKWRLLMNSSNGKDDVSNYWWIEKMIGHKEPRISMSKKGTFEAQFKLENANAEAREIGGFVFGCSADYSISNEERFARDKENLHAAVDWLAKMTEFQKLAVMVVCYRSPLDTEDADPFGRDMGRTSGPGRRGRITAIREALDLDAFGEKVIGREVVLVENLNDCDLEPAMRKFADLVLPTVNPKVAEMMSRTPSPGTVATQNAIKRKRTAYQQQLSVGSPKPTQRIMPTTPGSESKPKRQRVRNGVQNVGMQTNYFTLKARGLHVDWNKFPVPGGGTLGDGIENPVAEEYILTTTTPITTPERPIPQRKKQSPYDGLKDDLADLEKMMADVSSMFDNNSSDLYDMSGDMSGDWGDSIVDGW